jgi:hypothetical protein
MNLQGWCVIAACSALIAVTGSTSAAIVSRDYLAAGDGLLTYDTVNHREWLDIAATPQVRYSQLEGHVTLEEMLNLFDGFTRAGMSDAEELAISAGLSPDVMGFHPTRNPNAAEVQSAINLVQAICGESCQSGDSRWLVSANVGHISIYHTQTFEIQAWASSSPGFPEAGVGVYSFHVSSTIEGPDWYMDFLKSLPVGPVWLYRDAVPEPMTAELALVLVGFILIRHRPRRGCNRS